MVPWAFNETFERVATQPGSMAKKWDNEELIRCRAKGTGITAEADLKGRAHPLFSNWVGTTEPELHKELEQPILLASRILKAVGLPWLSDFLIDDIFAEAYPGRQRESRTRPACAHDTPSTAPHAIARHHHHHHHRGSSRGGVREKTKWRRAVQETLRNELPGLIQWQVDAEMFRQKGWNGYTCRHPRGELSLGEIDKYETIERSDGACSHGGSRNRNLTILVMAEYPARMAELRRQGKARGEEYLITAFMATVTLLHELGHAIYWRDRRSLTRDLREPFYGGDLEMELGDSFVAAMFGGWIPVPVCGLSHLQKNFSFADGVAWRQALNWDHHRMRPKYRAHYSISIDYIARLFSEASWLTTRDGARALIRPSSLTGSSAALQSISLCTSLTQTNQHATASIADFHWEGYGWVWNRRPGAWFRIPQFDGCLYPELELPIAGEGAMHEPVPLAAREVAKSRDIISCSSSFTDMTPAGGRLSIDTGDEITQAKVRVRGPVWSLLPSLSKVTTPTGIGTMKLSPRKNEYNPRKMVRLSPTTKIPRPVSSGSPVLKGGVSMGKPRKRDRIKASRLARDRVAGGTLQREWPLPSPPSTLSFLSPSSVQSQGRGRQQRYKEGSERGNENSLYLRLGGGHRDSNSVGIRDPSEISVDELKKRLSQLIGVSLTELEVLFEGPASAG